MRFLSVCSGIEAASVAWQPLGWEAVAFAEIEPFPCAVLAHHYPNVPNWGDMTKYQEWPDVAVDLLCGGTPCQSFSVAGLRKGLADPCGNLMLTFGAIAARYRPKWLVWENVPGVLSSNGGRDFGTFLGMLGQLGYGFAYRVLDAQYAGVPQRRRRVFVVGCLGDWRSAAAVLFERHSLSGHPAPSRQAGQRASYGFADSTGSGIAKPLGAHALSKGRGTDLDNTTYVANTLQRHRGNPQLDQTLVPIAFGWQNSAAPGDSVSEHHTPSLDKSKTPAIAFDTTQITSKANRSHPKAGDPCHPLAAGAHPPAIAGMQVRRLTPRECERLQGFPDDYTLTRYRGKPAADGPRYKALGNSWAVPVVRWIGERVQAVDAITQLQEAA